MTDIFRMTGSYATQPAVGSPSADPQIVSTAILQQLNLVRKLEVEYTLIANPAQSVTFGGLVAGAHVMILSILSGGKVIASFTSADGALQTIPIDDFAMLITKAAPFTALTLTRTPGTDTLIKIFMGEKDLTS